MTDANVVLGRIGLGSPLGGSLTLDREAAERALASIGSKTAMDASAAAAGVVTIVESHMERAIRRVSVEEGADPRPAILVAFGGAGGLHATALARRLDMAGAIVPAHAGVFSALGMLLAPPRADAARSVLLEPGADLVAPVRAIEDEARRQLGADGSIRIVLDVRYRGQSHETSVPYQPGDDWSVVGARFHDEHRLRNGFSRPGDPIELVTVRAEAVGSAVLTWADVPFTPGGGDPRRAARSVLHDGRPVQADVWWRPDLAPGSEVVGPAVVEEPEATTWLGPGERLVVHESGALEMSW